MSEHILHRIARRAGDHADAVALRFVKHSSGAARTLTWKQLQYAAFAARKQFRGRGLIPGDRVLLILPTGEAHASALLGALWAGLVPTTFPPLTGSAATVERELRDLAEAFAPRAVVGSDRLHGDVPIAIPAEAFGHVDASASPQPDHSDLRPLSYVQFTSGSTGRPRGVALHWSAIESNLEAIVHATGMAPGQRAVSWLPMHHDMGIFGSLLATLHAGCEHTLMDPSVFVANPLVWLRVLHERRATITVASPSALTACLHLLRLRPMAGLDLSSLAQVICGSEPIAPDLPRTFEESLRPYGVSETALRPVYGLAEATVAVTFTPAGRKARIDRVARQPFETEGMALPARPEAEPALEWVSAGCALPGVDLVVRDASGRGLPERRIGSVCLRSPSLYHAYLDEGQFHARARGWLDTGDLGYLADGELYVTGRAKDVIIKNGRNYSPDRLEHLAALSAGVRRCAAFGVFDPAKSTERIVVMVEAQARHMQNQESRDRLRLDVRVGLRAAGYQVDEICVVPKGTLPRTTSGKVRRRQCREAYSERIHVIEPGA